MVGQWPSISMYGLDRTSFFPKECLVKREIPVCYVVPLLQSVDTTLSTGNESNVQGSSHANLRVSSARIRGQVARDDLPLIAPRVQGTGGAGLHVQSSKADGVLKQDQCLCGDTSMAQSQVHQQHPFEGVSTMSSPYCSEEEMLDIWPEHRMRSIPSRSARLSKTHGDLDSGQAQFQHPGNQNFLQVHNICDSDSKDTAYLCIDSSTAVPGEEGRTQQEVGDSQGDHPLHVGQVILIHQQHLSEENTRIGSAKAILSETTLVHPVALRDPSVKDDSAIPTGWKLVKVPANTQDDAAIPIGWKLVTVPSGTQNDELVAAGWKLLTVQPISTDVQTYPAGFIFNGQEPFLNITAKIAIVSSVRNLYNDKKEEEHENLERQELLLLDHYLHQDTRSGLKSMKSEAKKVIIVPESVPAVAQFLSRLAQSPPQTSSRATWLDNQMLGSASALPAALYRVTSTTAETAVNTEVTTLVLWGQVLHHNHHTPNVTIQASQLSPIIEIWHMNYRIGCTVVKMGDRFVPSRCMEMANRGSIDMIETLLHQADSDHPMQAVELLAFARSNCKDVLVLSLVNICPPITLPKMFNVFLDLRSDSGVILAWHFQSIQIKPNTMIPRADRPIGVEQEGVYELSRISHILDADSDANIISRTGLQIPIRRAEQTHLLQQPSHCRAQEQSHRHGDGGGQPLQPQVPLHTYDECKDMTVTVVYNAMGTTAMITSYGVTLYDHIEELDKVVHQSNLLWSASVDTHSEDTASEDTDSEDTPSADITVSANTRNTILPERRISVTISILKHLMDRGLGYGDDYPEIMVDHFNTVYTRNMIDRVFPKEDRFPDIRHVKPRQKTGENQSTESSQEVLMEQEEGDRVKAQAGQAIDKLLHCHFPHQLIEDHSFDDDCGQQPSQHKDYLQVQILTYIEYKDTAYLFTGMIEDSYSIQQIQQNDVGDNVRALIKPQLYASHDEVLQHGLIGYGNEGHFPGDTVRLLQHRSHAGDIAHPYDDVVGDLLHPSGAMGLSQQECPVEHREVLGSMAPLSKHHVLQPEPATVQGVLHQQFRRPPIQASSNSLKLLSMHNTFEDWLDNARLVDNNNNNVLHRPTVFIMFTYTSLVMCSVNMDTDEFFCFVSATPRSVCRIDLSEMCECILIQRRY